MNIFGIGLPEMAVIAAIGLLVFGPKRLPELGKTLGRTLKGFQSASSEFEKEFRTAMTPVPDPEPSALVSAEPVSLGSADPANLASAEPSPEASHPGAPDASSPSSPG